MSLAQGIYIPIKGMYIKGGEWTSYASAQKHFPTFMKQHARIDEWKMIYYFSDNFLKNCVEICKEGLYFISHFLT